jgi:hypothetical protein
MRNGKIKKFQIVLLAEMLILLALFSGVLGKRNYRVFITEKIWQRRFRILRQHR